MTVTVSNPTHRTAEEIGRTTVGPRPLPPLGSTREVPLPEVLDVTLATGLRVLVARNPRVPMAELRLRVPFGPDAAETGGPDSDTAVSRHLAAAELLTATLLTGTATRDRVAIDDELAGVGADLGVGVDPGRLQIGGSGRRRAARRAGRARRRAHRRHPPRRGGRPRARPPRRTDHDGPRPAAHDRAGGVAAQAVRHPPDHEGAADGRRGRRGRRRTGARAAGRVARAGRVDPHPRRGPRPGSGARRGREAARGVDGRPRGPGAHASAADHRERSGAGAPARLGAVAAAAHRARRRLRHLLRRSAARQPRVRRPFLLALDGEHPRGQGLHHGAHSGVEFVPGGGCWAWRPTWPATSPPPLSGDPHELGRLVAVPPTRPRWTRHGRTRSGRWRSRWTARWAGLVHLRARRRRPHPRLARRPPRASRPSRSRRSRPWRCASSPRRRSPA